MEPLALALSCFAGALIFRRTPASRSLLAVSLCAAVGGLFLLDTGVTLLPLLRLILGAGLAALLPPLWERAKAGSFGARLGAGGLLVLAMAYAAPLGQTAALCGAALLPALDRLPVPAAAPKAGADRPAPAARGAEKALRTMHGVLAREDPVLQPLQLAEVYDFAAEQVCRCCVRGAQCWEQNAEDTYRDLCAAGEAIVQRGAALREDLPERFAARCCHTEGFLTAVNQSLDAQLARRREDYRRAEGRRVAAGQYLALERLLAVLTRPAPQTPLRYAPELAVGSACRVGNEISGDRGATCRDRFGCFYVLLCDGMGAGPAARTESDRAVRLLTAFLETGLEADTALELLNDFYVLRKDAAFATLDLLKLDLRTGDGTLYKWGAAPSCLRRGTEVEKIGTATPPPGLEAAEGRVPGQYELSLREGETLVMVSDGAWGEETARRLSEFGAGTVRDLASCLITLGEGDETDDRTVVVVRLCPLEARL
jgi:stage II sporulation protein E